MHSAVIAFCLVMLVCICLLVGCSASTFVSDAVIDSADEYETEAEDSGSVAVSISGAQAREIYESDDGAILLDVRNQDEFDEFHIAGSVLIPVDELELRLSDLPDKNAIIIVFCKGGRRSDIAAGILIENGYINVLDMGAIDEWEF